MGRLHTANTSIQDLNCKYFNFFKKGGQFHSKLSSSSSHQPPTGESASARAGGFLFKLYITLFASSIPIIFAELCTFRLSYTTFIIYSLKSLNITGYASVAINAYITKKNGLIDASQEVQP